MTPRIAVRQQGAALVPRYPDLDIPPPPPDARYVWPPVEMACWSPAETRARWWVRFWEALR